MSGVVSLAGKGGPGRPPHAKPAPEQPPLDGLPDAGAYGGKPGAMVAAVSAAVAAGRTAGMIADLDGGLAALAVECARAVDFAVARRDPYGVATTSRELRDVLGRLRLDPTARNPTPAGGKDDDDPLSKFLADLSAPQVGDAADARPA